MFWFLFGCILASRSCSAARPALHANPAGIVDRSLAHIECPIKNCKPSFCIQKQGVWTCTSCSNRRTPSLPASMPKKSNTECVCPQGTTQDKKGSCAACALGFYCLQPADNKPATVSRQVRRCPANTVTRRQGAQTLYACVNNKGYYFLPKMLKLMKAQALKAKSLPEQQQQEQPVVGAAANGEVAAAAALTIQVEDVVAPCGPDSYSTGLEYQTQCTPCPEGFHTDPDNPIGSHTSPAVCVLAPGTYSPDNATVLPCPQGEFADAYALRDSCTPCEALLGPGITTQGTGSTSASNCSMLEPGYAPVDAASQQAIVGPLPEGVTFSAARPCPQNYTCRGGDPAAAGAPTRCPRGLWTQVDNADDGELEAGASSPEQCVAPPGWFDPGQGLDISECPAGTFKEDWGNTAACTPCGEGPWLSDRVTQLQTFDLAGSEGADVMVRGSSSSCYIQAGMGVIRKAVGPATVFQALVCPPNFYGTDEKHFGLELLPCLACPLNQITYGPAHRAATYLDAAGEAVPTEEGCGYFSPLACANQPGYGYTAAGSQQCDLGTFNPGLDMAPCRDCPFATTTLQRGSTSAADCAVYAPGFGRGRSGNPVSCPLGAYSDGTVPVGLPCTPCGNGRSTTDPGSESVNDCRICALGYGGADINHCIPCGQGTYGPREARGMDTDCLACPTGRVYKFHWESEYEDGDDFAPWATSPMLASSTSQCLAAFSQTVEGNFWLDLKPSRDFAKQARELTSIQSCARDCYDDDGCAAASYSYSDYTCWLWRPSSGGSSYSKSGGIAFKTVLSNYRAQSVPSDGDTSAAAAAAATGEAAAPSPGVKALQSNEHQAIKAATIGTGFYTFWPGAGAASALDRKSLQDVAGAATLLDCLRECNMRNMCAGVIFGALDTATMALQGIEGAGTQGVTCQQIIAQIEVTGMRTLIRTKHDALRPD